MSSAGGLRLSCLVGFGFIACSGAGVESSSSGLDGSVALDSGVMPDVASTLDGGGVLDGSSGADALFGHDSATQDSFTLTFERQAPGNTFTAIVTALTNGQPLSGLAVSITSSRGTVSPVAELGETYQATVTPDTAGTGEYDVVATAPGLRAEATALVFASVGTMWNQPQAVSGYVNTAGWEDSASISADGQWLFLQYVPVAIDCLLQNPPDPSSPLCTQALGPWSSPARPGMLGANRISSTGVVTNGCPSLGVTNPPVPLPPEAFFGFARQPDGSFAAPFVVGFDGDDGCAGPFGPQVFPTGASSAKMVFAYQDPRVSGSVNELYVADVALGSPTSLGDFTNGSSGLQIQGFLGTELGLPVMGNKGNPWVDGDPTGTVRRVFYDDETDMPNVIHEADLSGSFPVGPWVPEVTLGLTGTSFSQPFFDGTALTVRSNNTLVTLQYQGGSMDRASAWGAPVTDLSPDPAGFGKTNALAVVGEPSIAQVAGQKTLYFVYAVQRAGNLDLNVGFVPAN